MNESAITRIHPSKAFEIPDISRFGFVLTPTGMIAQNTPPTFPQWKACGQWLKASEASLTAKADMIQFAIGDWLNYGEKHFKDYRQASQITGFDDGTLRNFAYVSRRFPLSSRNYSVRFKHFQIAAPNKDREMWLEHASEEKWSTEELRQRMHEGTTRKETHEPIDGIPATAPAPPDGDEVDGKYSLANHGERIHLLFLACRESYAEITRILTTRNNGEHTLDRVTGIIDICRAMSGQIDDLLSEL